jgi:hypothetical protein
MIEVVQQSLNAMQGTVTELAAKIEAIQNSEANVFDPTQKEATAMPNTPIAQQGGGATE